MEKQSNEQISNNCADEILHFIKLYHKTGNSIQLYLSEHDIFEKTLYLNKFDDARLAVGGQLHTLTKCPLKNLYDNPIFSKLNSNGYTIKSLSIPTKYIESDDGVERAHSYYKYHTINESSMKPIYDAYNKFKTFITSF